MLLGQGLCVRRSNAFLLLISQTKMLKKKQPTHTHTETEKRQQKTERVSRRVMKIYLSEHRMAEIAAQMRHCHWTTKPN